MRCCVALILVLTGALTASAQTAKPPEAPPFTSAPSIEDRNLYYSFLTTQQTIFTANQAAKAKDPSAGPQIDQQTAAVLHITVAELPAVVDLVQQASQGYAQIPALRQAYEASGSLKLTPAQLDGIDDYRKLEATARTVFLLSQRLSPTSWAGLRNYIHTDFKNSQAQPKP